MKRWAILMALGVLAAIQAGCGDGMAYTARERQHRAEKILENEMKQMVDDWDLFWLNDRRLRTTAWTTD